MSDRNLSGWLAPLAAGILFAAGAQAAEPGFDATVFDSPLEIRRVDLGPTDSVPVERKEVRCSYFPAAMVKVVDEREVGAAQLSILPAPAGQPRPACQLANLPNERVLDPKIWSGYFAGMSGGFAVFSADDGTEGGMGFAIFHAADAKLVFSGIAKGPLQIGPEKADGLVARYQTLHTAKCSVATKGATCAQSIARETGLAPVAVADCKRGYAEQKRAVAVAQCAENNRKDAACIDKELRGMASWDSAPSVVGYPVELAVTATGATQRALGPVASCVPSE